MSNPTPRAILHLDMDCFYVSVERLRDPALEGKPVAVGGPRDSRGVISSASYEARAFGVRSAMPVGRALQLCPNLILVSSPLSHYGEYSQKIRQILEGFTPLVQMASQDEAYLDLSGTSRLWGPPLKAAEAIRQTIHNLTRLPCSIGLASNKLVAKVASALCKPRALLFVPPGSEASFLAPLPIRRMPGIGPKAAEKLATLGVKTIGQAARLDNHLARRHFGNQAAELLQRCQGIASDTVLTGEPPKSIGAEETFHRDTTDADSLHATLSALAEKVAARLRRNEVRAATITLKYRYGDFETHTAAITLSNATDDETTLLGHANRLLRDHATPGRALRLVGITGSNLVFGSEQADLFEEPGDERRQRLHAAIDSIRDRHGFATLRRASTPAKNRAADD